MLRAVRIIIFGFIVLCIHGWAALAIYFCGLPAYPDYKIVLACVYLLSVFLLILFGRFQTRSVLFSFLLFLAVVIWFISIKPNPSASYPEHLTMPYAEFNGDTVTIYNVRNSHYRTADDFDDHFETRTYDITKIKTVDVLLNYWGMDAIAHTFVSFGFSDGSYLPVSIEIRPEVGEKYGLVDGFFKQYELIYVWADERDVVRVRTNYSKQDVYLYRLNMSAENIRKLFVSMLQRTNVLHEKPEFYNTLLESCTNTIGDHLVKAGIYKIPFWKRRFLSGDVDQRLYHEKLLDTRVSFSELRRQANINERGKAADQDMDFSSRIRTHLD